MDIIENILNNKLSNNKNEIKKYIIKNKGKWQYE